MSALDCQVGVRMPSPWHCRRLPKSRHLVPDFTSRRSGPGRIGTALCGMQVFDAEAINHFRVEHRQPPLALHDFKMCGACQQKHDDARLPACDKGKHTYHDHIAAELAISEISRRGKRSAIRFERRSYWCERHHGWHLTSQEKK